MHANMLQTIGTLHNYILIKQLALERDFDLESMNLSIVG